jgi:REP element-mobilizing transposase RayT
MKQQKLFNDPVELKFGGSLLKGKRRSRRPLSHKRPIHLVLKATSTLQLLRHTKQVEQTLSYISKKFGVRVYSSATHADHIHLAILTPNRTQYVRWVRALTSLLCQRIRGLKWRLRPFTRISAWGKAFQRLKNYIFGNKQQGNFIVEGHATLDRLRQEAAELFATEVKRAGGTARAV